ncbi:LysR family transcriptional regulator [Cohaesibacter celericrescens]|uniref:LysR family transcriptional regulator n=1 Tax=Cohaesibacter celericrescens TaxID=2067669 RepID=A0A2N5XX27_9HYPH|nr:LysR family transcriptional regulator [Cohaesibacter celericrescens]PLW78995.1 LysR family transcriptional regulator [Cohaesibacter celericrescens]
MLARVVVTFAVLLNIAVAFLLNLEIDRSCLFDYPVIREIIFTGIRKMIDDYRSLAVFVAIADTGSLSAAGRRLKLSTSVISHHLSRLEKSQGVTLFFRSTRSMSLTPEGHLALDPARRMMAAGEEALDAINAGNEEPVGALHVAMPAFDEQSRLHYTLWDFAKRHPMVAISLHCSDAPADLVKDGFDLAIRLGTMRSSSLKSRRIADFKRLLVASPDYLAGCAPIGSPQDLVEHDFIAVTQIPSMMTLERAGKSFSFEPTNMRVEVNTVNAAKAAVLAGLGIWHLPLGEIEKDVAEGRLIHVLPDWNLPVLGIYAVWPDIGPQKSLTRRLIDHFLENRTELML